MYFRNYPKTTLKNIGTKLNKNQIKIIGLIKNNPYITREEIAKKTGITTDGVKYNLNKLVKNNIIERIGPSNGGYWTIKK